MTYYNPVFKYGEEAFVRDASASGVDGLIVPDLPPDEAGSLIRLSREHSIDTVFLLAPTSTPDRVRTVAKASRGFIYYVSITGITGARLHLDPAIRESIEVIRALTRTPVAVGFGVSTPEEARAVSGMADGVIVGSAIVRRIKGEEGDLREFLVSLRGAIGPAGE
jgi:tryptophan synthase alpha chain